RGVAAANIKALGFPVSPYFADPEARPVDWPDLGGPRKLLYIINTGKKKAGKIIDRLLSVPNTELTITAGRDTDLKARLMEQTERYCSRVRILGWTNQMPKLMLSHHVVIGKAGGALVQEAIAARCPMIANQVIPGQEEGNARLIRQFGLGSVAEKGKEVVQRVEEAFAHHGRLWQEWRANLLKISRPDAALRIAE